MAKQRTERAARADLVRICSYVALVLAAVLIFINNLLPLIGISISGQFFNILGLIKDIALLIGISFGAFAFARAHGKTWLIIFWIAFVLYIASAIMGLF